MDFGHALAIERRLAEAWPAADCELLARDTWEFLVAVILSGRTADSRVNEVMAVAQERFLGVAAYARCELAELERLFARVPLHRRKARAVREAAQAIVLRHGGVVPLDPPALAALPGVGPKTAAVVMGNRGGQPAVAVDVHVERTAVRLGLAEAGVRPADIARAIERQLPPQGWVVLCHRLIRLGREHCRPRRPWCSRCPLAGLCPRRGVDDGR
jgi:endonuclease-3